MIKQLIAEKIKEIEQKENIKVIYATEAGSRAWGFASSNSDYDVRFIYIHPKESYLKLEKTRDVIELLFDGNIDICGWDLQKALRLLHSSNPALFEWSNSPIVYISSEIWEDIKKEINRYFLLKSGLNHYLSMASSNYREYLKGDVVKLKKYFYVIRPLLACRWILEKRNPPPVSFTQLVESVLAHEIKPFVYDLLEQKINSTEIGEGKRIDRLNEYIDSSIIEIKKEIENLPQEEKADWTRLNELFLAAINE